MRLVCPLLEEPLKFDEGTVNVLVIENPVALRNLVQSVMNCDSEFVLSENFKPIEMSKHLEFVNNVFDVDFVSKNVSSKINAEINSACLSYQDELHNVFESLNSFGNLLSANLDFPAKFSLVQETEKITKLLGFTVDTDGMSLPEKLLEYMNICRRFFKKKVFVFLNLKCYLSVEELRCFYHSVEYEEYRLLLVEAYDRNRINEFETTIVIDNDLCII